MTVLRGHFHQVQVQHIESAAATCRIRDCIRSGRSVRVPVVPCRCPVVWLGTFDDRSIIFSVRTRSFPRNSSSTETEANRLYGIFDGPETPCQQRCSAEGQIYRTEEAESWAGLRTIIESGGVTNPPTVPYRKSNEDACNGMRCSEKDRRAGQAAVSYEVRIDSAKPRTNERTIEFTVVHCRVVVGGRRCR